MHPWQPAHVRRLPRRQRHRDDAAGRARRARRGRSRTTSASRPRTPTSPYRRFVNPTDLRVAHLTCAPCHESRGRVSEDLAARHDRGPPLRRPLRERRRQEEGHVVRDLPTTVDPDGPKSPHGLKELPAGPGVPAVAPRVDDIADALPRPRSARTACSATPGREAAPCAGGSAWTATTAPKGCAACHVTYADVGFSESARPDHQPSRARPPAPARDDEQDPDRHLHALPLRRRVDRPQLPRPRPARPRPARRAPTSPARREAPERHLLPARRRDHAARRPPRSAACTASTATRRATRWATATSTRRWTTRSRSSARAATARSRRATDLKTSRGAKLANLSEESGIVLPDVEGHRQAAPREAGARRDRSAHARTSTRRRARR